MWKPKIQTSGEDPLELAICLQTADILDSPELNETIAEAVVTDSNLVPLTRIPVSWQSNDSDSAEVAIDAFDTGGEPRGETHFTVDATPGIAAFVVVCGGFDNGIAGITGTINEGEVAEEDDTVVLTVVGPPNGISLTAVPAAVDCDGETPQTVTAFVVDSDGNDVVDGTLVNFTVNSVGTMEPPTALTVNGVASSQFVGLSASPIGVPVLVTAGDAQQSIRVDCTGADFDGDGMPDYWELGKSCLNPNQADGSGDPDGDGLTSLAEFNFFGSHPCLLDSDADGPSDASDNCPALSNPAQANTDAAPIPLTPSPSDTTRPTSDARGDACDTDDDGDDRLDANEASGAACGGTFVTDPLVQDTDGDRVVDGAECALGSDPSDPGSKPALGPAGDSDGDGVSDNIEIRGYATSPTATDSDFDGCPDDTEIASVDSNTVVNSIDLLLIAQRFLMTDKPVHDIDKNGTVNSLDLLLAAQNFMLTPCPSP